ncbi:MAG: NDP-hexose 2,3-dehydratase family protein [Patescibacteria group bacterium]
MNLKEEVLTVVSRAGHHISPEVERVVESLEELVRAERESDIEPILAWLKKRRDEYPAEVTEIPLKEVAGWSADAETGNINHQSGGFFSVIGVRTTGAGEREVASWDQPIVKQMKSSISGVLCQRRNGIMHYLFHGKFEPGNLHKIQISPALQATPSNLERTHTGRRPRLAEYFADEGKGRLVTMVEGAEDGGRFFKKTIRNMLVEVDETEDVPITNEYIWLTRPQIMKLLMVDGAMNSLSRSVCVLL